VEEVKTKYSVISDKQWRETLADIWQLLVEGNSQSEQNLSIPRNAVETSEMKAAPEKRRAS